MTTGQIKKRPAGAAERIREAALPSCTVQNQQKLQLSALHRTHHALCSSGQCRLPCISHVSRVCHMAHDSPSTRHTECFRLCVTGAGNRGNSPRLQAKESQPTGPAFPITASRWNSSSFQKHEGAQGAHTALRHGDRRAFFPLKMLK